MSLYADEELGAPATAVAGWSRGKHIIIFHKNDIFIQHIFPAVKVPNIYKI